MGKSLFYRWFGLGKIPDKGEIKKTLESEGIILSDEGLPGTVIYRNFKAPGRYHSYKSSRFAGSIVLTEKRFIAFVFSKPVINIPWGDERLNALNIEVTGRKRLAVRFDVARFHPEWSGTVECRFSTPKARDFLHVIQGIIR